MTNNDERIWPGGNEPFDYWTGIFHDGVRYDERDDDSELRKSMREFG
jgi:hypothetical protein